MGLTAATVAPWEPAAGLRVLLVTDAWHPQVNGVVHTLETLRQGLAGLGDTVEMITPARFRTLPCPSYPEIRLALASASRLAPIIESFRPDAVHLATEGPLGLAARRYLVSRRLPFTTAFHTRFPEYLQARLRLPLGWTYALMRWFHRPAAHVMVATESLRQELAGRGFDNVVPWTRGVDTRLFRPLPGADLGLPRPVHLYVGRVAVEKNLEAFLRLPLAGTKLVVGEGPARDELARRYPEAVFAGPRYGEELARHYAAADVFVFPSRTDTFGLVLLEALACGLPVAAYPVTGPRDVLGGAPVGALHEDLGVAVAAASKHDRAACRAYAERFGWDLAVRQFRAQLAPWRCTPAGAWRGNGTATPA